MESQKEILTYKKLIAPYLACMRYSGLVAFENETLSNYKPKFLVFMVYFSFLYISLSWGITILQNMLHKNNDYIIISEFLTIVNTFGRYTLAVLKRDDLRKLLEICHKLWMLIRPEDFYIAKGIHKKATYYRKLYIALVSILYFSYIAECLFRMALSKTTHRIFPFAFFYEPKDDISYLFLLILQCTTVAYIIYMGVVVELLALYFFMMGCAYFRVMREKLISLNQLETNHNVNMSDNAINDCNIDKHIYIKNIVFFHQNLLIYCEVLNKFIGPIYFWLTLTALYNTSIIALKLIEEDTVVNKYLLLLFGVYVALISSQGVCQYLQIESEAIVNAAYGAIIGNSYNNKSAKYALYFIMIRAQKLVQITAGGIVKLSFECFAELTKNAFSAFMIFRQLKN